MYYTQVRKISVTWLVLAIIVGLVGGFYPGSINSVNAATAKPVSKTVVKKPATTKKVVSTKKPATTFKQIKKFTSANDFKNYVMKGLALQSNSYSMGRMNFSQTTAEVALSAAPTINAISESDLGLSSGAKTGLAMSPNPASDYSSTNVQVLGIDEPDIIKNNGKEIFYSTWSVTPVVKPDSSSSLAVARPDYWRQSGETKVINAFPPEDLKMITTIDLKGDLLLSGNNLAVFTYDKIVGYDITDRTNPKAKWTIKYENNNRLVGARLYQGKIYFVTRQDINVENPCPIRPLSVNGMTTEIVCANIYHPTAFAPVSNVFSVFSLDMNTGAVLNKNSFVGTDSYQSVLYFSPNAIYVTYYTAGSVFERNYLFLTENADMLPAGIVEKLKKLRGYDISDQAKLYEMEYLLQTWAYSLDQNSNKDAKLKLENDLNNRVDKFYARHLREFEKTGIVKIGLDGLQVVAVGEVPGQLLNQFSLDEYGGNLRAAVTVGQRGMLIFDNWNSQNTRNDVYVLNGSMQTVGSVKDLGKTERIYSARFVGDRGYLVTFRQTDPFYVLDLSVPNKPVVKGELKIPGYSSYLHPLGEHRVLGIGKEDNKVKVSLFDASDPANPTELSKYILNEYWSEAINNHHAFLSDSRHQVFFLPGSQGGYIFSYANGELKLSKAVSDINPTRALYMDNYLYIVAEDKMVVLNELTWEKVNEYSF